MEPKLHKANTKAKFITLVVFSMLSFMHMEAQVKVEVKADSVQKILVKEHDWVVLDVRTPEEFTQGHVPGALNINVHDADAFTRIDSLKKDAKYIVYCRTRNRSNVVSDYMIKNGFKNVYQMIDGIGGWNQLHP